MLFAIVMITAIIIIVGFGLQLEHTIPIELSPAQAAHAIYVCPAESTTWDSVARGMRAINRYAIFGFFGAAVVLMFVWGWRLYQNLLEDKFTRTSFTKVWQLTKFLFWAGVIVLIMAKTPNHFRSVHIDNADGNWVLCDYNTPGARAVRDTAVHSH